MANVLQVRDLKIQFDVAEGVVKAVDGVSFRVPEGKTVALVGESGSGKSVVSQSIMGLLPKSARVADGEIIFFDPDRPGTLVDIVKLKPDGPDIRRIRGDRISMVFQEPMSSLSPLHTVGDQISESLLLHQKRSRREARDTALPAISPPASSMRLTTLASNPGT